MERGVEYNYFLPTEILIYIFNFLDPHTLVFNCRSVCLFWKQVVECTDVWKTQISREAEAYTMQLKNILPTAHLDYPWYLCYVLCNNIFYKNLLPDYCRKENLTYWRDILSYSTGLVCSAPLQIHLQGYSAAPQELQDEDVRTCLLTSFGDSGLNQTIDLYRCGFTRKIFEFLPAIHISEWFAVGYQFSGMCHFEVTFFNSKCTKDNENGFLRCRRQIANREWHKVSHTFTNYRPDVRYITLRHGINTHLDITDGRYREILSFGKAAAKVAGGKIVVAVPELMESHELKFN